MPERCHRKFRNWYDYSGGTMTDWGAHHMDIGYWAVGLPAPTQVESKMLATPIPGGYTTLSEYEVKFTYPNGVIFNVRTTADDSPFGAVINPDGQRNGIRFEGTDGWIWVNRDKIEATDRETALQTAARGCREAFISATITRATFSSACAPARIRSAMWRSAIAPPRSATSAPSRCAPAKSLQWDSEKEIFTGEHAEEANRYISREMRKPYDHTFIS